MRLNSARPAIARRSIDQVGSKMLARFFGRWLMALWLVPDELQFPFDDHPVLRCADRRGWTL